MAGGLLLRRNLLGQSHHIPAARHHVALNLLLRRVAILLPLLLPAARAHASSPYFARKDAQAARPAAVACSGAGSQGYTYGLAAINSRRNVLLSDT